MDGKRDPLTQSRDEPDDLRGLGARRTVEPGRHADDHSLESIGFPRKAFDLADDALHGRLPLDRQGGEWPGNRSRRIADRKTNAAAAHVDAEDSHTPML
jgi:hypothetical protein